MRSSYQSSHKFITCHRMAETLSFNAHYSSKRLNKFHHLSARILLCLWSASFTILTMGNITQQCVHRRSSLQPSQSWRVQAFIIRAFHPTGSGVVRRRLKHAKFLFIAKSSSCEICKQFPRFPVPFPLCNPLSRRRRRSPISLIKSRLWCC